MNLLEWIERGIIEVLNLDVAKMISFGPNYRINKKNQKYDVYGALRIRDIFTTKSIKGKFGKDPECTKVGRLRDFYKRKFNFDVAALIYMTYLEMMLEDVIEGNIVQLTARKYPVAQVGLLTEAASNSFIRAGAFPKELNLRNLDYKIPRIIINFGPTSKHQSRVIYVPKDMYNKYINKIIGGFKYLKVVSHVKKSL